MSACGKSPMRADRRPASLNLLNVDAVTGALVSERTGISENNFRFIFFTLQKIEIFRRLFQNIFANGICDEGFVRLSIGLCALIK